MNDEKIIERSRPSRYMSYEITSTPAFSAIPFSCQSDVINVPPYLRANVWLCSWTIQKTSGEFAGYHSLSLTTGWGIITVLYFQEKRK